MMEELQENSELKLFISYSHADYSEEWNPIKQFKRHLAPLKHNNLVNEWYDRDILPGADYQSKIDNNLEEAGLICLFISSNFLDSENCMEEKRRALDLRSREGVRVIPIILSPCGWKDMEDISKLEVLPEKGTPVSDFQDHDKAFTDVYKGLKEVIKEEVEIRRLKITENFERFLENTNMLAKAHSQKEKVCLGDIFVYPELEEFDKLRDPKGNKSSEKMVKNILDYQKVAIAGESQSGKTTLCKKLFKELRKKSFVPVYVTDGENKFRGKIKNKIHDSLHRQYEEINVEKIDRKRIVPIVDDFHLADKKGKHIKDLSVYPRSIVTIDDVFGLNIKDEHTIKSFVHFEIKEFKPSLRNKLIKKWVNLSGKKDEINNYERNFVYKNVDKTTELVNSTLGKTIGRGIMPAYPFFILSTIVTHDTFEVPLDEEITSQGHCYQALIYFYLKREDVDDIETYINFLTEFAFYLFKEDKNKLSTDEFNEFLTSYLETYNLPVDENELLSKLSPIVSPGSFNNYSFRYRYLYYYFVAKYLAENLEDDGVFERVKNIIENLHVNENAYITVFLAHHSKSDKVLQEVEFNALALFEDFEPATLTQSEVKFFDDHSEQIIQASLPSGTNSPEKERKNRLEAQDKIEEARNNSEHQPEQPKEEMDGYDALGVELRRATKTVEVIGRILKNRAGSLEKTKLKDLFENAMNNHLRVLTSFFEIIKNPTEQEAITDFISERLLEIIEEKEVRPSEGELKELSRTIFWNLNFFVVKGIINKIVDSLGSDRLTEIIEKVCDEENSPATFLVKHGVLMWYNKNLQIERLAERIEKSDFSEIAKRTIKFMVVDHNSMHKINYKDKQRIEDQLGISSKRLLREDFKS